MEMSSRFWGENEQKKSVSIVNQKILIVSRYKDSNLLYFQQTFTLKISLYKEPKIYQLNLNFL